MPTQSPIQRRNQALIAFVILTGARDLAIASMKLRHVDLIEGRVHQDAREVRTKFSKTFGTTFFPVGEDIREIVSKWLDHLRAVELWGLDDPLFPKTRIVVGRSRQFEVAGTRTRALVDSFPDPPGVQGGVRSVGAAVLQPPFVPTHAGRVGSASLPNTRGVQGVVAEPRP